MPVELRVGQSSAPSRSVEVPAIHAFQKSKRLRRTDEISSVFSFKCQVYGEYLRILVKPNGLIHPRFTAVVRKKTVILAVNRNYIKRSLREIFRLHQSLFDKLDVVVLAHKGFDKLDSKRVEHEFLLLARELNHAVDRIKCLDC